MSLKVVGVRIAVLWSFGLRHAARQPFARAARVSADRLRARALALDANRASRRAVRARKSLTVTATLESWDFRWAYVVRYAQRLPALGRAAPRSAGVDARRDPRAPSVLRRALRRRPPLDRSHQAQLGVDRAPHRRQGKRNRARRASCSSEARSHRAHVFPVRVGLATGVSHQVSDVDRERSHHRQGRQVRRPALRGRQGSEELALGASVTPTSL